MKLFASLKCGTSDNLMNKIFNTDDAVFVLQLF